MRGNYKTRLRGGQNLTAVKGNASVNKMNPVSRATGKGRAVFLMTWVAGFDQEGGSGTGGAAQSVRGNYKSHLVRRTTSEERAERSRGWGFEEVIITLPPRIRAACYY